VLTVIGDLVEDIVVRQMGPMVIGTDNAAAIVRRRGGSGANVAAGAARLVATRFIGRVGADSIGDGLVEALSADGVDVRVQRGGRTGTVIVLVDDTGERTMFPDRAAAGELVAIDPSWLAGTAVLHIPAYGFGSGATERVLIEAVAAARSVGAALSVDASATALISAYGVMPFRRLIERLRPEFLFANADEAEVLSLSSSVPPPGCTWIEKQGSRPAIITSNIERVARVEVDAVALGNVADTTGAGDAFAAGFLAARIAGEPLETCAQAGHACAAALLRTSFGAM
jgi:sugar/nucleoside kinase (ribokinase family)